MATYGCAGMNSTSQYARMCANSPSANRGSDSTAWSWMHGRTLTSRQTRLISDSPRTRPLYRNPKKGLWVKSAAKHSQQSLILTRSQKRSSTEYSRWLGANLKQADHPDTPKSRIDEIALQIHMIEAAVRRSRSVIEIVPSDYALGPKNITADSTVYPHMYPLQKQ